MLLLIKPKNVIKKVELCVLTLYIQEMLTLFNVRTRLFHKTPSFVELNEAILRIKQFEEEKFAFPLIEAPLTNLQ